MALISRSYKCFNAMETALEEIKNGNVSTSVEILRSIKQDSFLLMREASLFYNQLTEAEKTHQKRAEDLTRKINGLYQEQMQCEATKKKSELRKSSLTDVKNSGIQNRLVAARRYEVARNEQREAEDKYDQFRFFFWVPIVGWFQVLREIIQENGDKAKAAYRDMLNYENEIEGADRNIAWANSSIYGAQVEINRICHHVERLKRKRQAYHEKLGDTKSMMTFTMEATTFWEEVVKLTNMASVKTEHLQRIMELAAEKNKIRILKSNGTRTKMRSFKEAWMEIAGMVNSDDNNLVLSRHGQFALR